MNKILLLFGIGCLASCTTLTQSDQQRPEKNQTKMDTKKASLNKASVKVFFKALENENVDTIVNLFAENAQHINPYHSDILPKGASGKKGIRAYWTPVFPNFDGMKFLIDEIYAMEDPSIVFVKYKGKIKLLNDAGYYENDYYSTFKFDNEGLIIEYVEIFNPIVAARGFGMLNQIK